MFLFICAFSTVLLFRVGKEKGERQREEGGGGGWFVQEKERGRG